MKASQISEVQITLDGMKDTHNKVKALPSHEDVFEKVLNNIELLNDKAPEIGITIRVNLTKENAKEYLQLTSYLNDRFKGRTNIIAAPAFVLDRGTSCSSKEQRSKMFDHKSRSVVISFQNCIPELVKYSDFTS